MYVCMFLQTVVTSDYHKTNVMEKEATVVSLEAPMPKLALKTEFQGLGGVTTKELVALQARGEGTLSTNYNCVLENVTFDNEQLANASDELKTLHDKLSLLRINSDGLLLVGMLIGGRTTEVVMCPPTLRKQITLAAHKTSHQGII